MKRTLFTVAVCLIGASAFGQKKVVNTVKSDLKGANPNFGELRTQIKSALENPETANSAEAWFTAGEVESKAFDAESVKQMLGQTDKVNEDVMYTALDASTAFLLKADELDQLPNEKGKIKSKFRKKIKGILQANRQHYRGAGQYFYEKENYLKAYETWKFYGDIPTLPMFEGDKNVKFETLATDTFEVMIRYYAGLSASLIPDHDKAIAIYDQIKDFDYKSLEIYKQLAYEYVQKDDSVAFEQTLRAGVVKFPTETYFLLNIINIQVNNDKSDEAIEYLNKAVEADPNNSQFLDVLGLVYEKKNDIPQAIVSIEKALAVDPNNAEALSHLGRMYYNRGVEKRVASDNITDKKKYDAAKKEFEDDFKTAIPYFEKAYDLNPEDSDAVFALCRIYYHFGDKNYDKWDEIYKKNNTTNE